MPSLNEDAISFISLFSGLLILVVTVGEYRRRNRGRAYNLARKGEYAKAIHCLNDLIRSNSRNAPAHAARGACQMGLGQLEQGIEDCERAISLGLHVHENFGNLGWACFQSGLYAKAVAHASQAIALRPEDSGYYCLRAYAHYYSNDYSKAIADLTEAICLRPDHAEAFVTRADANYRIADHSAALADGAEAVRLNPSEAIAWNLMAWIEATCPNDRFRNGAAAVEKAQRACRRARPGEWQYFGTLAAAYAEAGRFEEAIQFGRQVLSIAPAADRPDCEQRLANYVRGIPCRVDPLTPTQTPRR